jgi:AraC-like DNA-binding protein
MNSTLGPSFSASVRMGTLADIGVAIVECGPHVVTRTARDAAHDEIDDIYACVHQSGRAVVVQDGREAVSEDAGLVLLDMRRPFSAVIQAPTRSVIFKIPRERLEARLGSIAALTARSILSQRPVAGITSAFLTMISERVGTLDGPAASRLAEQALNLIALAFSTESDRNGAALSSTRIAAVLRLKAAVETSLCDPELKPASVAAAARVSVRYANALLSQEGSSLERYIQDRRLERCRAALCDPAQSHRTIAEIAYAWGFSDVSHFGRRFKAEYGHSPSDYRRQMREHPVPAAAVRA